MKCTPPLLLPILGLFAAIFMASPVDAQTSGQPLDSRVLAVQQNRIEIDRGLADGLRQGDRVRFLPPSGAPVEGHVSALTDRTATVTLGRVDTHIEVGTRAEAYPSAKPGSPKPSAQQNTGVEHPPWEQGEVQWPDDKPLLAPIASLDNSDRAVMLSGRIYMATDLNNDNENNASSTWSRVGADVFVENLFRLGGTLHADVEYNQSDFTPANGTSNTDSQLRIDRLAYAYGGDRHHPLRLQIGRFLQEGFPEFGVIDGGEASYRLPNGHQFGASLGNLPILYGNSTAPTDSQIAAHYLAKSLDGMSSLGAGIQKTQSGSSSDRNLLVVKGGTRNADGFYVRADAWVDMYDSQDNFKSGTELTRVIASAGFRDRGGNGWALQATQFQFPQLLEQQVFTPDPAGLIYSNREIRRGSLNVYRSFGSSSRGSARVSYWGDQDDSGLGAELRWSVRNLIANGSNVGTALFLDQGQFTDAAGLRLDTSLPTPGGQLRFFWETANYTNNSFSNSSSDLLQHRLRGSWDVAFSHGWSLSLYLEQRAGDNQDSQSAGFYLQKIL